MPCERKCPLSERTYPRLDRVGLKQRGAVPPTTFGTTMSASPPSPDSEQVSVGKLDTATPWRFIEPERPNGEKPDRGPPNASILNYDGFWCRRRELNSRPIPYQETS